MAYNRDITASFTGHRSYDGSRNHELEVAIRELYDSGYRYFLSGMAVGFDLAAAEATLALRNELTDIKVVAVVPFEGMERKFSAHQQEQFNRILSEVDEVITLASAYSVSVYAARNNFLVENSSATIAYFTGEKGGTAYTVRRAVKSLHRYINICPSPQRELEF